MKKLYDTAEIEVEKFILPLSVITASGIEDIGVDFGGSEGQGGAGDEI